MISRDEVVDFLDNEALAAPDGIRDAIRIVRGHLRRGRRPSSVEMQAVDEEPITARHHFAKVSEELKKGSEPPER